MANCTEQSYNQLLKLLAVEAYAEPWIYKSSLLSGPFDLAHGSRMSPHKKDH